MPKLDRNTLFLLNSNNYIQLPNLWFRATAFLEDRLKYYPNDFLGISFRMIFRETRDDHMFVTQFWSAVSKMYFFHLYFHALFLLRNHYPAAWHYNSFSGYVLFLKLYNQTLRFDLNTILTWSFENNIIIL